MATPTERGTRGRVGPRAEAPDSGEIPLAVRSLGTHPAEPGRDSVLSAGVTPRWLTIVDALTVALIVGAACVWAFGGFRETVGGVRISIRDWQRVALLALVIAALRHAFVPRPAMPRVYAARAVAFWRSDARREAWPAFISTRVTVLAAGYLAVVTFGIPPGLERFRLVPNEAQNLLARWDVAWYLSIITHGYAWDYNPLHQQNVVFFPAFPAITYAVGLILGKQWLLAGLVVALGAFFAALVIFYRHARQLMDPDRARTAVWALASYPFAAYFSVPYTESLYLLAAVGAFSAMTRGRWWHAAASGYIVGLCRPNGFLIALPLGILGARQFSRQRRIDWSAGAAVVAPLAGVLTYSAYLYLRFGDALAWSKGQLAWGRTYPGLWPSLRALWIDRYDAIANLGLYHYSATNPYDLMYTAAALFVLASVIPTTRRFGPAYGVFTLVNVMPPLLMGGMMSIGRMTSVLFPAFLWLGAIVPPRYCPAMIAAGCMLQGLVAALFFGWRPVF